MTKNYCAVLIFVSIFVFYTPQAYSHPNISKYKEIAELIETQAHKSKYRGWNDLVSRLKKDNLDTALIEKIYTDSRMPYFTPVTFKLEPKESKTVYSGFLDGKNIGLARRFLHQHKKTLEQAKEVYQVDPQVLAAILLVETHFGEQTGEELVIYRLSRLADIAKPINLKHNYEFLKKDGKQVTFERVEKRGKYVQELFYPEILALFKVTKSLSLDPFKILGSRAGAFGIPQFLPSTFLKFAVDGNSDGQISLFQMEDAIHSAANFLSSFGWNESASLEECRAIIRKYNRSDAYVDTIMSLRARLS